MAIAWRTVLTLGFQVVNGNTRGLYIVPMLVTVSQSPKKLIHGAHLILRIACGEWHEHTNPPHALALLRARRERPRCRAAKQSDKIASPHGSSPARIAPYHTMR